MHEVFDADGILVGWIGYSKAVGREVFVPRRDEDIESDRREHCAEWPSASLYNERRRLD
jgi:hypothetical protein